MYAIVRPPDPRARRRALAVRWLALGLLAAAPGVRAGEPVSGAPLAWRLEPSAVAVYDSFPVSAASGPEHLGAAALLTVYGHDLREDRQYRPVMCFRDDLPAVLGLRLPRSGVPSSTEESVRLDLADGARLSARVTFQAGTDDGTVVELEATWKLETRRTPPGAADLRDGQAKVRARFDRARGVVVGSRVSLSYLRRPAGAPRDQDPTAVAEVREIRLREVRNPYYEGFRAAVSTAIDRGIAYLRSIMRPDGWCTAYTTLKVGPTALVALTLAACGVPRDDPNLARALSYLSRNRANGTYENSVVLMALERAWAQPSEEGGSGAAAPVPRPPDLPREVRTHCANIAAWLEASARLPTSWSYAAEEGTWNASANHLVDASNTQYAALALLAASRLGIPVKEETWLGLIRWFGAVREERADRAKVTLGREQSPGLRPSGDGRDPREIVESERTVQAAGFRYRAAEAQARASMTVAGIGTLEVARHALVAARTKRWTPALAREVDDLVDGGWAWLDLNWGMDRVAGRADRDNLYYSLYGLERAGIFSGVRLVGGRDWYYEGAVQLLLRQSANGSWQDALGVPVTDTCFALLFLKRATAPLTPR